MAADLHQSVEHAPNQPIEQPPRKTIEEQKTRLWALAYEQQKDVVCCDNCGTTTSISRLVANPDAVAERRQRADLKPSNQPDQPDQPDQPNQHRGAVCIDDRYDIIRPLAEGGMGSVYLVHDKVLDKEMAIKMLRQDLAAADGGLLVRRFEQEARSALEMTHVNVVAAYGQGHNKDGAPYLVMEYVAGESLARLIQTTGALEIHQALGIFMQVCEALAHAHMKNLIHRDIKSANVLLQHTDDGGNLVKLVDFGIAKTLPLFEFETLGLTQTGEILGSPAYMSPEHCLGEPVDERSDMYSLGCVMYEALTGQPPFADKHPIKAIMQHLKTAPPSLARRVRIEDQPGMAAGFNFQIYREAIDSVIMRCLEKDPARRYQSADELRLDLEALSKDILPQPRTNKNPAGRPAFWPEGPSDKGVVQPQKEGRPEAAITLIVLILVLIALWIARAI